MPAGFTPFLLPLVPLRFIFLPIFPASFISTWEPMYDRRQLEFIVLSSCFGASPTLFPVPPVSHIPGTAEVLATSRGEARAVGKLRKIG